MRYRRLIFALFACCLTARIASAQTADDVVEKHLSAMGGRAALGKLTSRSTVGTMTLSTPAGDITGPIEILSQPPNKTRTLIKMDLSALGAGRAVSAQWSSPPEYAAFPRRKAVACTPFSSTTATA